MKETRNSLALVITPAFNLFLCCCIVSVSKNSYYKYAVAKTCSWLAECNARGMYMCIAEPEYLWCNRVIPNDEFH